MTSPSYSQPNARTFTIVDLVDEVSKGRVRVPKFQRPLRWQWSDVQRLFDSITKGYPIGSLLLWQRPAPKEQVKLGPLDVDAPLFDQAWWVVDGQQRIVSLASALLKAGSNDPRYALAYDLEKRALCKLPQSRVGGLIPLYILYDLQALFEWFVEHPEAKTHLNDATRVTKAIREFSVPAYIVENDDEFVLRDIFDRMNNTGKRLTRAEVFAALHPDTRSSDHNTSPSYSFEVIADAVDAEFGFGKVDGDTILHAILARRGPDVSRDIRAEFSQDVERDFGQELEQEAYREGGIALRRAVAFLQKDAHVPHFLFLPYRLLLVILVRFFAHFPNPAPRNRTRLRRWFWRAALIGIDGMRGGNTGAMRALMARIVANEETDSIDRLLSAPMDAKPFLPQLSKFNTKSAEGRAILCALWNLRPTSFQSDTPYSQEDLSQALGDVKLVSSVLVRLQRRATEPHRNAATNRIFVLGEDALEDVLEKAQTKDEAHLATHCLTKAMVVALEGDEKELQTFWSLRTERMGGVVKAFFARMLEEDFEDTPPLRDLTLDDGEEEDDVEGE
jgi:hypothetical protein